MSYSDLANLVTFRPVEEPIACAYLRSPFSASWTTTVRDLARELDALGARDVILEVDMPQSAIRLDGLPRADRHAYTPGIVISFKAASVPGEPTLRYEVGTYDKWHDNVRAVALGLRALRAVDRYGVTKRGEQYSGWRKLLVAGRGDPDPERGRRLIEQYGGEKAARRALHSDTGGEHANEADFADVQAAIEAAKRRSA